MGGNLPGESKARAAPAAPAAAPPKPGEKEGEVTHAEPSVRYVFAKEPEPAVSPSPLSMIQVKKSTCVATVRKADLPLWEAQDSRPSTLRNFAGSSFPH